MWSTFRETIHVFIFLLGVIAFARVHSFILFHTAAEFFSILISFSIFIFSWSMRKTFKDDYLHFIGIGYLFVGVLDAYHALAYKGIGIFISLPVDASIQIWIAVRILEAATFLFAFAYINKKLRSYTAFFTYSVITLIIIAAVATNNFPTMFVEGEGLKELKIALEIIICIVLFIAIFFIKKSMAIAPVVKNLLVTSLYFTIASEVTFTLYVDVYDVFNFLGHILKIISFYLIYLAVIEEGLTKPIKHLTDELIEKKKEYEVIFNAMPLIVLYKDLNNRIIAANKAAADSMNLSADEMVGKSADSLWPEDSKKYYEEDLCVIKEKKPILNTLEEYRTPSGKLTLEKCKIPVLGKSEEVEKILVIGKDVTERTRLKEENRAKEHQLMQQSKMAAMGEMIGAIAHQWRQPLNSLGLILQDVGDAYDFNELDRDYIEKIISKGMVQIKYMSKTIDDFRDYFKPNKEKSEFVVENAVGDVFNMLSAQLNAHNISFLWNQSSFRLFSYENELKQILINIINNAKDAIVQKQKEAPDFKGQIDVEIEDGSIAISNNGSHIESEIIDKIFEPYFTTKFQSQGTGIGLFMVRELMERHMDGRVSVSNTDDGVRFMLLFDAKKKKI